MQNHKNKYNTYLQKKTILPQYVRIFEAPHSRNSFEMLKKMFTLTRFVARKRNATLRISKTSNRAVKTFVHASNATLKSSF